MLRQCLYQFSKLYNLTFYKGCEVILHVLTFYFLAIKVVSIYEVSLATYYKDKCLTEYYVRVFSKFYLLYC